MRAALEAVAEFLARHGGLDEYDAVLKSIEHLGWELDQDHPARWRALFTVLRTELSDAKKSIDYVFVFERLLQLAVRVPSDIARDFFASKLAFHVIVSRFQAAYADYDADVFEKEKEVLLHAENIFAKSKLVEEKFYPKKPASELRKLLQEIQHVFSVEDPKAAWEALRSRRELPEVVFRRDMKRALRRLEDQVFGETLIEKRFPTDDVKPNDKRIVVPRRLLEEKYTGSSTEWRDLGSVVSIKSLSTERPVENRRESTGHHQSGMQEVVGETPPNAEPEDRVWSARLPIATPGGDSDTLSDTAMDDVVRQDSSARKSPGKAKKKIPQQRPHHQSPQRVQPRKEATHPSPALRTPPRQRSSASNAQQDAPEEIDDDGPDDDGDMTEEIVIPKAKRRGRKFWTEAEVEALVNGVKRFGGQWAVIKRTYPDALRNRSGVDLKDKYRNLVKAKRIPPIRYADDDDE